MTDLWLGIPMGVILIISGTIKIVTGEDGSLWGGNVPAWTGWLLTPGGLFILLLSLRGILRGEGKKKPLTDEDVAAGLKELERMYVKEHGALPEYPSEQEKGATAGGSVSDSAFGPACGPGPDPEPSLDAKEPMESKLG